MDLALDGALGRQEQVLRHLLGDRRAALHHVIGARVLDDGAQGAHDVDAEMLVEARILGGERGVDDIRRDFLERDGVVLPDAAPADDLAGLDR